MESELLTNRSFSPVDYEVVSKPRFAFPESRLLLVSAQDKRALQARIEQVAGFLEQTEHAIEDVAFTLATGRKAFTQRAAIVLPEVGSLAAALRADATQHIVRGVSKPGTGEVAMIFPGQGAQFLGMGRHLYQTSERYREIFDRCDELARPRLNVNLRDLLLKPAGRDNTSRSDALTQTAVAQPALFIVEYAIARVLMDAGVKPQLLLGHSIGEYAAACLANVFELEAAIGLVCERGRLMQSMPPGSMLAIRTEPDQLSDLLVDGIDLAAHNAPGLSVVSGPSDAVARVEAIAKERGLETRSLHTSHAFHSWMMEPILDEFARAVEQAGPRAPQIPLISTMTGHPLTNSEATSAEYWAKQLRNPVRFAEAAATACSTDQRVFVEVGPGVSLVTSVAKLTEIPHRPRKLIETLGHPKTDLSATEAVLTCLGQLWIENVELNFATLYRSDRRQLLRLPTYPYARKRHVISPPVPDGTARGATVAHAPHLDAPGAPTDAAQAEPSVDLEQTVLSQLSELLGARLGRTFVEDDMDRKFLELGFDSLALSQLAGKLKQQFQARVPVRQLFDKLGTPRLLAAHLATDAEVSAKLRPTSRGPIPSSASRAPSVAARLPSAAPLSSEIRPLRDETALGEAGSPTWGEMSAIIDRLARIEEMLRPAGAAVETSSAPAKEEDFVPPGYGDGSRAAELTSSQREIWVAARIGGTPANLSYNECRAFLFVGDLDILALETCLQELCDRHDGLRQTFSSDGEMCITHPKIDLVLAHNDLRTIEGSTEKKAHFQAAMRSQVETPFDLSTGPLIRGTLIRLNETERVLVLCAHHVAVDGSSWEVLIRELSEMYSAKVEGRPAQLPEAVPFKEYASTEQRYRASHQAREDGIFWQEHLKGQAEDLNLPTDRPRAAQRSFAATRLDQHLSEELVTQVRAAAAKASCTAQTFLFVAFQILLFRLTRQVDIVCGVPTSGQAAAGMDPLVGHCVHVLPIRALIDPARSVAEHISYVHGTMLDALEHQRATFSELLPKLSRPRDPSRPALIQASFGMGRSQKRPNFAGVETALRVVPRVSETFELYVYATEDKKGLEVSWSYNTDLFNAPTIELWQRCFAQIVSEMANGGLEATLAKLPILTENDRRQVLEAAQGPIVERPEYIPVHQAIQRQTQLSPQAVAVIDAAGPHSYTELARRANRIAHYLLSRNLEHNALVAVCLNRNMDLLATLLGVWRAGMGYVPLDPEYPSERIQTILEDAHAAYVITSHDLVDRVPAAFAPVCIEDIEPAILAQSYEAPSIESAPSDTAYVIFTSGSTGRPKGVQISQGAFQNFIYSMQAEPGYSATDTLLALTTISFDISGLELFLPLVAGGKLVIATKNQAINPKEIDRLLVQHGATILQATPATWQMLFESGWKGNKRLKVLCGGEGFPRHLAEKFLATCGDIWNVYGPTETTVWSTAKHITDASDLTIGRPIDNTTCYVLDENRGLVPQGVPGELWIGGQGVALGYLGRPELTQERFIDSPFKSGERIYCTGDLARLRADNEFECLGRVDFQVKIRGFRIELGEVESAMLKHPLVKACVAVAREDHPGEKVLAGYVVPIDGSVVDTEDLRTFLLEKLPAYMVPTAYCVLDSLPMTPNKKVDRKALPAPRAPKVSTTAIQVRDEVERDILAIWAEILQYPGLTPKDNFYAVGGQSLMAIRLIEQINGKFRTDLPVNELFNHPTVAGLSDLVRVQIPTVISEEVNRDEPAPHSTRSGKHRGLFLIQEGDGTSVPIFLIHGDKANALLPPRLSPSQEIWGYHHQGSDGERIRLRSVVELAEHCHAEWVARHGNRPCIVSGHSFGALVAYHVAVLRQNAGLPTPRLVIIDARHPDALAARQKITGPRSLKRRYDALRDQNEASRAVASAIAHLDRGEPVPVELRRNYVLGTYQLATLKYHPPEFKGMLEVLRSKEWTQRSPIDMWDHSAVNSVRRIILEGSHLSLVREPEGIALIAEQFRRICAEANQSG